MEDKGFISRKHLQATNLFFQIIFLFGNHYKDFTVGNVTAKIKNSYEHSQFKIILMNVFLRFR